MTRTTFRVLVAAAVAVAACSVLQAEDIEKRFRFGFSVGGYDARDDIPSDSGNVLAITDPDDVPIDFFVDPRNDSAAIGTLSIKPALRYTLSAQYAVTKLFVVEFSAGFQEDQVGDVEVQAQFDRDPRLPGQVNPFTFRFFRIPAGDLTQVPLRLTAMARFRPRASLNPYIGIGAGWTIVGFTPSDELNQLSTNIDDSSARFAQLLTFPSTFSVSGPTEDLSGASIEANDTFEWHLVGGAEYRVAKNWGLVFDVRYSFASRSLRLRFNGRDNIGVSVPNQRVFLDDPLASASFGALLVTEGGFIDGGRLVPTDDPNDPDVDCEARPLDCTFIPEPDGVPDTGFYYVQGGKIRYDHVTAEIGFRYTF